MHMYCKHCGKPLPADREYCPVCGKAQNRETNYVQKHPQKVPVPFYLMLAAGILFQLLPWTAKLITCVNEFDIDEVSVLKFLALMILETGAGTILLLGLVWRERIEPNRVTGKDTVVWLFWIALPWVTDCFISRWLKYGMGKAMTLGYIWSQISESVFALSSLWPFLMLLTLLFVRTGKTLRTDLLFFGSGALFVLWSFLLILFRRPALELVGLTDLPDAFMVAVPSFIWSVLSLWLRRLVDFGLMLLLAKRKLRWLVGAGIVLLIHTVAILLTPMLIFRLQYGPYSIPIAIGLVYLLAAAILIAAALRKKAA